MTMSMNDGNNKYFQYEDEELIIDKENDDVVYNDEKHIYVGKNGNTKDKKFISATTLIGLFENKFDAEFWSKYKALEALNPIEFSRIKNELLDTKKWDDNYYLNLNITEEEFKSKCEEIKSQWKDTNIEACEHGTRVHAKQENTFYTNPDKMINKFNLGGKLNVFKNHNKLDVESGIFPELLLTYQSKDGLIRIAGQSDLVIKNGNHIQIIDYKGLALDTKIPIPGGWTTMGELKEGDIVYDGFGYETKVIHKSTVHHNPCYTLHFLEPIEGSDDVFGIHNFLTITADEDHRWEVDIHFVYEDVILTNRVFTTKQLYHLMKAGAEIYIDAIDVRSETHFNASSNVINYVNAKMNNVLKKSHKISYIKESESVPTQCIEVDSPSHTYLCTENYIKTHNTNKEIKKESFYNKKTKSREMMKYPLNKIMDCNFYHYTLQLSLYAWMIQKYNPEFIIDELRIIHFTRDGQVKEYVLDYLLDDVIRMIKQYKKISIMKDYEERSKPIIF